MATYKQDLQIFNKLLDKQEKYSNVDDVYSDIEQIRRDFIEMRNELCLHCEKYKNAHLGSCNGCKYNYYEEYNND